MRSRTSAVLVVAFSCVIAAQTPAPNNGAVTGPGVTGTWQAEVAPGTTWTIVLSADGPRRLIGAVSSCSSNRGEIEIFDGRHDQDALTFKCTSLNRARTLTLTGRLSGDQIQLTWEKTGTGASPTDDAIFGASAPASFIIKRVQPGASDAAKSLAETVSRIRRIPNVSFAEIVRAAESPQNWATYAGNLQGHRYSQLSQITPSNVARLELAWWAQAPGSPVPSEMQATPLVVNGVMYTTRNVHDVVALDAENGKVLWTYSYTPNATARASGGGGRPNRGLAILGGTVFLATLDAHLVAIDAFAGTVIWDATVADARDPSCTPQGFCYSMTLAPLAVKDKVIVGVAGGEGRIRGFVAAFDAATGREAWRFHTIPAPGEPGHETWSGESWKTGGAPVWNTGTYDPETNLTYWGTGNPSPPSDGSTRQGDNLYSDSVVALDADTGKLKWYFQFTPHDTDDWDSAQVPVLADIRWAGGLRKVVLFGNRNGFLYVLDRATGQFLAGRPFVEVNWTPGLDSKGKPLPTSRKADDVVRPGSATNWFPPSYDASTGLFYLSAWERPKSPGGALMRGKSYGAVRAFDPATGNRKWEFRVDDAMFWRGVMTTASGLLFTGTWGDTYSNVADAQRTDGYLYALDAGTGEQLWRVGLGGSIQSPPITYSVRDKQYVAVAVKDTIFTFALR